MSGIAIFDSGVGGLSIYQQIKQQLPDSQYIFVSDNLAFPYGTKPEDELCERVLDVVERVIHQYQPDLFVVACNTASTVVLPLLREKFDLPIVGVVPAIKPAAQLSKSKHIGLLATPATIKRDYTNQLIQEFAADCQIVRVGSSRLVQIAEDKLYGRGVDIQQIEQELTPFLKQKNLDILVLACTHFPLLNKEIESIFKANADVKIIDSGEGIARRVSQLMNELEIKYSNKRPSLAVFTQLQTISPELLKTIQDLKFDHVEGLND